MDVKTLNAKVDWSLQLLKETHKTRFRTPLNQYEAIGVPAVSLQCKFNLITRPHDC